MWIPLTKWRWSLVDKEDAEKVQEHHWSYDGRYASRHLGKGIHLYLHSFISGLEYVDHENQDKLDNRKINLRTATRSQNNANRGANKNNKSGYKGVRAKHGKWYAEIRVQGKTLYLGAFVGKEEAAQAYDRAAIQHYGEFSSTNFPKENYK